MKMTINPYEFDRSLQIQEVTRLISGDINETWSDKELDVRAKLTFSGGQDRTEEDQPLNVERRRYNIMTSGRSYNVDKIRFRETGDDQWFYATGIYPWKGSKHIMVIEGLNRSND